MRNFLLLAEPHPEQRWLRFCFVPGCVACAGASYLQA